MVAVEGGQCLSWGMDPDCLTCCNRLNGLDWGLHRAIARIRQYSIGGQGGRLAAG